MTSEGHGRGNKRGEGRDRKTEKLQRKKNDLPRDRKGMAGTLDSAFVYLDCGFRMLPLPYI